MERESYEKRENENYEEREKDNYKEMEKDREGKGRCSGSVIEKERQRQMLREM